MLSLNTTGIKKDTRNMLCFLSYRPFVHYHRENGRVDVDDIRYTSAQSLALAGIKKDTRNIL